MKSSGSGARQPSQLCRCVTAYSWEQLLDSFEAAPDYTDTFCAYDNETEAASDIPKQQHHHTVQQLQGADAIK